MRVLACSSSAQMVEKRKNNIQRLHTHEGQLYTHQDKENAIYDHFSQVFGEPQEKQHTLDWARIELQRHDLHRLDVPFTEEETKEVIMNLPREKLRDRMDTQEFFSRQHGTSLSRIFCLQSTALEVTIDLNSTY